MYGQQSMMNTGGQAGPNMGGMGMGGTGMMDPSTNNQPLQFNSNNGKPLIMSMGTEMDIINDRQDVDDMPHSPELNSGSNMAGGSSMGQMGPMSGPWGQMMGPNNMMGMDPNNMMMNPAQMAYAQQYGYNMGGQMMDSGPMQKEVITLKNCVLYPPPPNAPPPSTRERPPGCRTVFVGGLPETITIEILTEIFENFGMITSKRMSKKNFAHIRYEAEDSVERALYLSAYRIKIEDKDDKPNTGRIHVDYAQARDDLYEWECKQRTFAREERHRIRMEQARLRPPSPPPVVHYTDHEASQLTEALKGEETFGDASAVLITWLERGDCNRRSSSHFYSMVQAVNANIRRVLGERQTHDEEFENVKIQFRLRLEGIVKQFEQIERIFAAVSKQKAWDHFTKAQRKNLDVWRKQANVSPQAPAETIKSQRDEFFKEREEAEMEMSDNEEQETAPKKKKYMDPAEYAHAAMLEWQTTQLKDENESLKCQLEAYKNEVELVKYETKTSDDGKDKQVKALQNALQGMQQQLIKTKLQLKSNDAEITALKKVPAPAPAVVPIMVTTGDSDTPATEQVTVVVVDKDAEDEATVAKTTVAKDVGEEASDGVADSSGLGPHTSLPEKEARILALLSTFLHVHPFGASIDYIWSYLQRLELRIRTGELEDLMERYPTLYKQDIHGVGASIEKRWKFIGFDPEQRSMILL